MIMLITTMALTWTNQPDVAGVAQVEDTVGIVVKVGEGVIGAMDRMDMGRIIEGMVDVVVAEVVVVEVVDGGDIETITYPDCAKSARPKAQLGAITVFIAGKSHTRNTTALKKTSPGCNGGVGYTRS